YIGKQLKLKAQFRLFTPLPALGKTRSTPNRCGKSRIAPATDPALRDYRCAAVLDEFGDQCARPTLILSPDLSAERDLDDERVAAAAVSVATFSAAAGLRVEEPSPAQLLQRPDRRIGDKNYTSTVTPIAPVRPATWHEFFAPETYTPRASIATFHGNCY